MTRRAKAILPVLACYLAAGMLLCGCGGSPPYPRPAPTGYEATVLCAYRLDSLLTEVRGLREDVYELRILSGRDMTTPHPVGWTGDERDTVGWTRWDSDTAHPVVADRRAFLRTASRLSAAHADSVLGLR